LKILFILPEYYPHSGGGIATYYQYYLKALLPFCEQLKIITGSGYVQEDKIFEHEGITVEYLKPQLYQKYLGKFTQYDLLPDFKRNIAAAWAMWEQADEGNGFDMIECTDFALGFIPWTVRHTKPVITRLHGSMGQISLHENSLSTVLTDAFIQQAELLLLPACDRLITHSKANLGFWDGLLNSGNTRFINPVYNSFSDALPLSQRDNYGLVTGRIQKWKGPAELCTAYGLLTAEQPMIKWIGYDKPYNQGESTAAYLKNNFPLIWEKHIVPERALPHQQIYPLQQKARFGMVPSTWDMFNFSCIEFMSVGTPVICSTGAGAAGLIEHKKNGFKYPANDSKALAECITEMLRLNEKEYQQLALAGQETIKAELSPGQLIPVNLQVYQSVMRDFKTRLSAVYLDALFMPSSLHFDVGDVLDQQPLKKLTRYYIKRIRSKLRKKK
jgi:glycosyltransferase involved in cell wall biosynthesis